MIYRYTFKILIMSLWTLILKILIIIFTFTFVCILKELFEIICIRKHLGVHASSAVADEAYYAAKWNSDYSPTDSAYIVF